MNRQPVLVLGTRGSDLARAQADAVEAMIRGAHPKLVVRQQIIRTTGDRRPDLSLSGFGKGPDPVDKGIFTRELELALEKGEIDFAVHSLKDVPTEMDDRFVLAAVPGRAPVEDVLISHGGYHLQNLPRGARVATSAVRRRCELLRARPDLVVEEIRGNVPTRLRKLLIDKRLEAIVLARAGLERLGLLDSCAGDICRIPCDGEALTVVTLGHDVMMPSAGQGALGIQARADDVAVRSWLSPLDDPATHRCVRAERAFLAALGAGCQTPVGANAREEGGILRMRVRVYAQGWLARPPRAAEVEGASDDPEGIATRALEALR